MSDQDMPLSAWADKDGIEPPDLGLTSHPHPIDLEAELDMILHRFMYTFAPDGTVKPENFVTLDVPQAKAALRRLIDRQVQEGKYKLAISITTDKGDAYFQGVPIRRYAEQLKEETE